MVHPADVVVHPADVSVAGILLIHALQVVKLLDTGIKMLCRKPFMRGLFPFGCKQCMPCRINRNREWAHRIMLESYKHEYNSFVTVTYSDEFLPEGGVLVRKHYQQFLNTLRKKVRPLKVRYYVAAEYGEISERPHFHFALFGVGQPHEEIIKSAWGKGHVLVGTLSFDSAQYICGYIQKGWNKPENPALHGRPPEFGRMSLKPGLGGLAIGDLVDAFSTENGCDAILSRGDVPSSLDHGRRRWPLGRYLKSKLRKELGLDEELIKQENMQKWNETLCQMLEEAVAQPTEAQRVEATKKVFVNKQKILNIEAKAAIFKKGGTL